MGPSRPPSFRIRRAGAADAACLTRLAHASKRHWGYPERWIRAWRGELTLTPEYVASQHVELLEIDGRTVGCVALCAHGPVAELEHLWVDPARIGRGFGRLLLERAQELARELGVERIEIDSDPHAERFYLRFGARRIGRTPAPVDDDPQRYLPRLELRLPASR